MNTVEQHVKHETPASHIEMMHDLAGVLEANSLVASAVVDDWGRYSNFSLVVTAKSMDRFTSNKLKSVIRKALKAMAKGQAHLRSLQIPGRATEEVLDDAMRWKKRITGWEHNCYRADIDFQDFDEATNTFHSAS